MGGTPSRPRRRQRNADLDGTALRERALLEDSELPGEIQGYLRATMDSSRLAGDLRMEVLEELVAHFQDGLAAGLPAEDLLTGFGDGRLLGTLLRQSRRESRWSVRGLGSLGAWLADSALSLSQDIRHAVRGLRRNPGYAAVAILTMALGIGANTSVFSVVNGVLLRALPLSDPDRLVVPVLTNPAENLPRSPVGYADYLRWKEETGVFQRMGLHADWNVNITGGERPERVKGAIVDRGFFEVLGAPPLLGRTFVPEEHEPGGGQVAILSEGLWARHFGSDPEVIGRTTLLDGESYVIVGVVPREAMWPRDAEIWMPLTFGAVTPDWVLERDALAYSVLGRLQPGVRIAQARAVVDQIARRAAAERPETRAGFGATLIPLRTWIVGEDTQRALWLLMGCVGFVLLIACANVANLTLDRALERKREISIRAAIGAGRRRSVRPLAWECILVALAGGVLGMAVSLWGTKALAAMAPATVPGIGEMNVDLRLLVFGLGLCIATGIAFTLAPTLAAGRIDLQRSLSDGGARGGTGTPGSRARNTISVIQMALSVILVLGATLTVKSTTRLLRTDPGFRDEGVLAMKVFLPHAPPTSSEQEALVSAYRAFAERLESLPGAVSASVMSALPFSPDGLFDALPFRAEDDPDPGIEGGHLGNWNIVGIGFFETMGIPLSSGRTFSRDDGPTAPGVAILSESLARDLFPGRDPVGMKIRSTSGVVNEALLEVVGVAADVRYTDLADAGRNVVYVPQAQSAWRAMALAVRFNGDPTLRADEVREAIWAVDPSVPVTEIRTMAEMTSASLAAPRFAAMLVSVFAALALALAGVGVYGVVNISLRQRSHELGVRKALGAEGGDIGKLLVGQGVKLAGLGVALGLPAGLALTRLMSGLLYQVRSFDPVLNLGVLALLGLMTVLAVVAPVRRAARIDPVEALRRP